MEAKATREGGDLGLLRLVMRQARPCAWLVLAILVVDLLGTPLLLLAPLPLKVVIDSVIGEHAAPGPLAAVAGDSRTALLFACAGLLVLTVLAFVNSVIGAYYYLRVLVFMYMREPAAGAPIATPMRSGYVAAALLLSALLVLVLGIVPSQSLDMAIKAAAVFGPS